MNLIEKYFHSEIGYNPFLIREGFQVAQLNYLPNYGFNDMDRVEAHRLTDEAFILFQGVGILIAAAFEGEDVIFDLINMKKGVTYNIPAGVWHNIAMSEEAQMIIVEKDHTHLNDCYHQSLTINQREQLKRLIDEALKGK